MRRKLRHAPGALAVLALLGTGAGGCGDNAGNPVGFGPSGQESEAVLLLQTFVDSTLTYAALVATIYSPPPADGFRIYIEPDGQGFRPASDAPVPATYPLGTGWSVYQTVVEGYDPAVHTQVVARGALHGVESAASPMTNTGYLPATTVAGLSIVQPVTLTLPADSATVGATPTLSWNAVPGATRYLLEVFNTNGGLHYAALVPTNTHVYGSGPGTIFEIQPLRSSALYRWMVHAVDGGSHIFARSQELQAFFVNIPPPPTP